MDLGYGWMGRWMVKDDDGVPKGKERKGEGTLTIPRQYLLLLFFFILYVLCLRLRGGRKWMNSKRKGKEWLISPSTLPLPSPSQARVLLLWRAASWLSLGIISMCLVYTYIYITFKFFFLFPSSFFPLYFGTSIYSLD
ncbi:hypothetical protein F4775DRAFT_548276 [Biscogniauxia sp. FL1348]|nr:hypothetical protein F4775DRAFT_548276 [Biscogniauxia sp. FL1348]